MEDNKSSFEVDIKILLYYNTKIYIGGYYYE